jgi:hypothetical protein
MNATKTFRPVGLSPFERFNLPSTCGCCGRTGLKKTVKMTDGAAIIFMGTGCAQNAMNIDPDNFRTAQRRAQDKHERIGAYRAFLDAIVPAFAGQEVKQRAMVSYLGPGVFHTWRQSGKIIAPPINCARVQFAILGMMILNQDIDGNPITSPFTSEDMPTVIAWQSYLRSLVRAG